MEREGVSAIEQAVHTTGVVVRARPFRSAPCKCPEWDGGVVSAQSASAVKCAPKRRHECRVVAVTLRQVCRACKLLKIFRLSR